MTHVASNAKRVPASTRRRALTFCGRRDPADMVADKRASPENRPYGCGRQVHRPVLSLASFPGRRVRVESCHRFSRRLCARRRLFEEPPGRQCAAIVKLHQLRLASVNVDALPHGPGELKLGLFNPQATAGGFDLLTFSIVREGQTALAQSFTTLAAAQSFFDDQVITLAPSASGISADRQLDLTFQFVLDSQTPGQGFASSFVLLSQVPESAAIAHLLSAACLVSLRRCAPASCRLRALTGNPTANPFGTARSETSVEFRSSAGQRSRCCPLTGASANVARSHSRQRGFKRSRAAARGCRRCHPESAVTLRRDDRGNGRRRRR